jgi:hypothetical protein
MPSGSELDAAASSRADVAVLAQDEYQRELRDAVGGFAGSAGCLAFIAVYPAFATRHSFSQSSSVGTLCPYPPDFSQSPLSHLYRLSTFNTPSSPPAFSFIYPFGCAPESSASASSTHSGCIAKVASLLAFGGTQCKEVEPGDEFRHGAHLPIRLGVGSSPFTICVTQRILHASDALRSVFAVIHPALTTCSATRRGRFGATSYNHGGVEQESTTQGGTEREYGAELVNGDIRVDVEGEDDEWTNGECRWWMRGEKVEVCEESSHSAGGHASAAMAVGGHRTRHCPARA